MAVGRGWQWVVGGSGSFLHGFPTFFVYCECDVHLILGNFDVILVPLGSLFGHPGPSHGTPEGAK